MTMQAVCFKCFKQAEADNRPLSRNDLCALTGFSLEGCMVVLRVFRRAGLIRYASNQHHGRGVFYELVPGATYGGDKRGKSANSVAQLQKARGKRKLCGLPDLDPDMEFHGDWAFA
jgi:hypothetical protein